MTIWAGVSLLACVTGTVLIRTSAVGRITWKNRVAAYLVPWGWRLGKGLLWPIPVASWAVWLAVAAVVVVLMPPADVVEPKYGWRIALGVGWAVDAAALMYLVGTLRQHYSFTSGRAGHSLRVVSLVLIGLIAASAAVLAIGWPHLAVMVAGGPPLAVGVVYGLFVVAMLVFGNGRWN
ncbi:MAG: hypothetical protein ABGY75_18135 [Gemmataceae bacterium]